MQKLASRSNPREDGGGRDRLTASIKLLVIKPQLINRQLFGLSTSDCRRPSQTNLSHTNTFRITLFNHFLNIKYKIYCFYSSCNDEMQFIQSYNLLSLLISNSAKILQSWFSFTSFPQSHIISNVIH